MKMTKVMVARIYVMESSHLLEKILDYVHNGAKLRGVSVFRAISGFGETGEQTSSFTVQQSFELQARLQQQER
jgi:hypothetical protein